MDRKTGAVRTPPLLEQLAATTVEDREDLYGIYKDYDYELYDSALTAQKLHISPMYGFLASSSHDLTPHIESIDHRTFEGHQPGFDDYVLAVAAGRVRGMTDGDVAVADCRMMEALAAYTLSVEFEDKPVKFLENGGLSPRNYRDLVNKLGKQLMAFELEGEFGKAENDEEFFRLFATMNGLTVAAIMSGSTAVRQRAIDYFGDLIGTIDQTGSPAIDEAIYLGKLLTELGRGKTQDDITQYKELLGEDWDECLAHYVVLNAAMRQTRLLESPAAASPQAANHYKKHLHSLVAINAVLDKYRELSRIASAGTSDDHIDTDPILDTNELFVQLDWTVLPPGEKELTEAAEGIVAEAHGEVRIDLERLKVLKEIKDAWGADRAYYARGRLKAPRKASIDGQERPDEYIVLVLQDLDHGGNVVCEHAIAESPIAGSNALYVFRGDVSEDYSWREVYSVPKKEARRLGARPVKHTQVGDRPLLETMTEKVTYLITCKPDEFRTIEFNGRSVLRFRKLGSVATVDLRQAS